MKRFNDSSVSILCTVLVGLACLSMTARETAAEAPADAKHLMTSDGTIVAILASGESYYGKRLGGGLIQTVHLGNFWHAVAGIQDFECRFCLTGNPFVGRQAGIDPCCPGDTFPDE